MRLAKVTAEWVQGVVRTQQQPPPRGCGGEDADHEEPPRMQLHDDGSGPVIAGVVEGDILFVDARAPEAEVT